MSSENTHYNHLIGETSPYLQMHVSNPVDWYPWGKEALEKAKMQDNLLVISIGYAACHWCHVMEHESFADEEVAEIMNTKFVSVKIDREERPDIDKIYMDAAHLLNGNGGWPLNVIALPDGKPIFAGTYFPKKQWISILDKLANLYVTDKHQITRHAETLTKNIQISSKVQPAKSQIYFDSRLPEDIYADWSKTFDYSHGGISKAPKFPMPVALQYLLEFQEVYRNNHALDFLQKTLDEMGKGGIYDHIDGGFARYSVDKYWHVPHFEKMLYDNAQLISLYSKSYTKTKNINYLKIAEESVYFVLIELTDSKGLFYAALDADSDGDEGAYYVWDYKEIRSLLGDFSDMFIDFFMISKAGNWEKNRNILHINESKEKICKQYKIRIDDFEKKLINAKSILSENRKKRIKPTLDNKIITEWNALMISALCDIYKASGKEQYLTIAINAVQEILKNLFDKDGVLYRNFINHERSIQGFLPDYAFLIKALLDVYDNTFDVKWAVIADELYTTVKENFHDTSTGLFFYTSKQAESLITRKIEIHDNVIPASNSVMAQNLIILSKIFDKEEYYNHAEKMLTTVFPDMVNGGAYMANWLSIYMKMCIGTDEISIVGSESIAFKKEFDKYYKPLSVFIGDTSSSNKIPTLFYKKNEANTKIYICKNKNCTEPFSEVSTAIKYLQKSIFS